jgi:hypothetical protein
MRTRTDPEAKFESLKGATAFLWAGEWARTGRPRLEQENHGLQGFFCIFATFSLCELDRAASTANFALFGASKAGSSFASNGGYQANPFLRRARSNPALPERRADFLRQKGADRWAPPTPPLSRGTLHTDEVPPWGVTSAGSLRFQVGRLPQVLPTRPVSVLVVGGRPCRCPLNLGRLGKVSLNCKQNEENLNRVRFCPAHGPTGSLGGEAFLKIEAGPDPRGPGCGSSYCRR